MDHGRVELRCEQGLDAFTGGLLDEHEQIDIRRGPWLNGAQKTSVSENKGESSVKGNLVTLLEW